MRKKVYTFVSLVTSKPSLLIAYTIFLGGVRNIYLWYNIPPKPYSNSSGPTLNPKRIPQKEPDTHNTQPQH